MTTPGWRKYLEKVADPDTACQQPTDATAWNVEGLCQYLSSLGPAAPGCETVSNAVMENPVYSAVQEAGGTYTVTVSVDIRTTVEEQDALTLSASCGGQIKTQPVTGAGSCSVSGSFDAGQSHTWILRGDVPAGIATAQKYVITETIGQPPGFEGRKSNCYAADKRGNGNQSD